MQLCEDRGLGGAFCICMQTPTKCSGWATGPACQRQLSFRSTVRSLRELLATAGGAAAAQLSGGRCESLRWESESDLIFIYIFIFRESLVKNKTEADHLDVDGEVGFWEFKKRLSAAALTAAALRRVQAAAACASVMSVVFKCRKGPCCRGEAEKASLELPIMHSAICGGCGLCLSCCGEPVQICVQLGDAKSLRGTSRWVLLMAFADRLSHRSRVNAVRSWAVLARSVQFVLLRRKSVSTNLPRPARCKQQKQ